MKKMKWIALALALVMVLGLVACGGKAETAAGPSGSAATGEPKILKLAESFAYASLDAHKDWNGWYTSIYGLTETLFRIDNDLNVQPCWPRRPRRTRAARPGPSR